jgi:hypothetical protein
MATSIASRTATVDPWQLRVIKGDNALKVVTKEEAAATAHANDSDTDDLFAGRQHPKFLPRFLSAPDGMEWS